LNPPPNFVGDKDDPLAIRDSMLKSLDAAVGRIVAAVDKNGFKDNTIVVFTNDNGPVLESMSEPYRGTKNTTFEGGVRVPCLIRWPGHIEPGSENNGMMFVADWFPTFNALARVKEPTPSNIDGINMIDMLFNGNDSPRDEIIFEVSGSVRLPTIRKGDYKLMGDMLFNVKKDPSEKNNIAKERPKMVEKLSKRLASVAKQRPPLGDKPLLMDPPLPYIYGQEENQSPPKWLKDHVDRIRSKQPKEWAPGTTPWPQAPKGAHAAKQ